MINKCIKYVIDAVEGLTIDFDTIHPWRKDAKHIIQHSLRVKSYAESLIEMEKLVLNTVDEIALPIAIIFHDIGKIYDIEEHAKKSAEVIKAFLDELIENKEVKIRIIELIRNHSNKKNRNEDVIMNIMIDADALDEIGMQSVMMSSNFVNKDTPFYFLDLESRLRIKEMEFVDNVMSEVYTKSAKEIVLKKKRFLETVIDQLEFENRGSLDRESVELIRERKYDF